MKLFGDAGPAARMVLTDPRQGERLEMAVRPAEVPQVGRLDQLRRAGRRRGGAVLQPGARAVHRSTGPAGGRGGVGDGADARPGGRAGVGGGGEAAASRIAGA